MKREDVFEHLEPPPGGVVKLRERMSARPSPMARRLVPAFAAVAIAAAVLLFLFRSRPAPPDLVTAARDHAALEQVALGLAPSVGSPAVLPAEERGTTALAEVRTSNSAVAFYWVSSTSGAD